jgi:hypothetical protein
MQQLSARKHDKAPTLTSLNGDLKKISLFIRYRFCMQWSISQIILPDAHQPRSFPDDMIDELPHELTYSIELECLHMSPARSIFVVYVALAFVHNCFDSAGERI